MVALNSKGNVSDVSVWSVDSGALNNSYLHECFYLRLRHLPFFLTSLAIVISCSYTDCMIAAIVCFLLLFKPKVLRT